MRLSVHLMVRNGAAVLGRLVDSVRGAVDEVCFVDTGSTDGTPDVLGGLCAKAGIRCSGISISPISRPDLFFHDDERAYSHQLPTSFSGKYVLRDWAAARNLGLELCRGDYVMKLDADDQLLTPDRVSSVLDGLDQSPEVDVLMCPYEVVEGDAVHHLEMYTRLWRNRKEIRFREAYHENVDWYRRADCSNWITVGNVLSVRDWRDSVGDGVRVPHRGAKVMLREYERLRAAGKVPSAHLVMYLADELSEVCPALALELLETWICGLHLLLPDAAWAEFVQGKCRETLGEWDRATGAYARAASAGFHHGVLRAAFMQQKLNYPGWRDLMRKAVRVNTGHYYPRGASLVDVDRANLCLAEEGA